MNRFVIYAMLSILSCLTLDGSGALAQEILSNNAKEKKILTLVAALPEVQQHARQIKLKSNGLTQITLMISSAPQREIPYYQVNVNNNAPNYENIYQFAVDPKTYQIFYYDAATNKQYSLAEWRKKKKR